MEHYLAQMQKDMELRGFADNIKEYYFRHITGFLKPCSARRLTRCLKWDGIPS